VLGKAYVTVDPRIWGINGDLSESSYNFTVDFLKKVGFLENPVPFKDFYDRRFVDQALKELGRK
jgi:ABC-type nitrate/sulfonate/bicarbonate transport system substrate-binding protein